MTRFVRSFRMHVGVWINEGEGSRERRRRESIYRIGSGVENNEGGRGGTMMFQVDRLYRLLSFTNNSDDGHALLSLSMTLCTDKNNE